MLNIEFKNFIKKVGKKTLYITFPDKIVEECKLKVGDAVIVRFEKLTEEVSTKA